MSYIDFMIQDHQNLQKIVARAARHWGVTLSMTKNGALISYQDLAFYMAAVDLGKKATPKPPEPKELPEPKKEGISKLATGWSWEAILSTLNEANRPLTLTQIAAEINLSEGRTAHVLRAICLAGKAVRTPASHVGGQRYPAVFTLPKKKPGPVPGTRAKRRSSAVLHTFYAKVGRVLRSHGELTINEIAQLVEPNSKDPEMLKRHLRNRLNDLREQGLVVATGKLHGTRYHWAQ